MKIRNLAQIKKVAFLLLVFLTVLPACSKLEDIPPQPSDESYPKTIAENGENRALVDREGGDPLVILAIRRRASESIKSFFFYINGGKVDNDKISVSLGVVMDTDKILPEGVVDTFSFRVKERGSIKSNVKAYYDSGNNYETEINFYYGND